MKSVLSKNCCEKKEKPFPKLMISVDTGSIYLMVKHNEGTRIHAGIYNHDVGYFSRGWSMSSLKDYEGDVCLTND